jgi:hypothetical protein
MAWSSGLFTAYFTDVLNNTTAMDLNTDANLKVALFGNASKTPDKTVTSANSAYAAGVWASDGVEDATGWPAVGRNLATVTSTFASNVYTFNAADTVSANDTTSLAAVYGLLLYDDDMAAPVADQGILFMSLSGPQSVTSGRFTIVWNASGLFTVTV